jgi:hypothetical protein
MNRAPGVPRQITDADVERVITQTLESTPRDATHWSTRTLAKHSDMSQSAIARIWKAFGLQPHRTDTFKLSKDPLFVPKVRDIVGLLTLKAVGIAAVGALLAFASLRFDWSLLGMIGLLLITAGVVVAVVAPHTRKHD